MSMAFEAMGLGSTHDSSSKTGAECFSALSELLRKHKDTSKNSDVLAEINNRERCKNEIIVFNVPEVATNINGTGSAAETPVFREMLKELAFVENICEPKYLRRLGRKKEDGNNSARPIIIGFHTQFEKEMVLSKRMLLKQSELFMGIRMRASLTPMQRQQTKIEHDIVRLLNDARYQLADGQEWVWRALGFIKKSKVHKTQDQDNS